MKKTKTAGRQRGSKNGLEVLTNCVWYGMIITSTGAILSLLWMSSEVVRATIYSIATQLAR